MRDTAMITIKKKGSLCEDDIIFYGNYGHFKEFFDNRFLGETFEDNLLNIILEVIEIRKNEEEDREYFHETLERLGFPEMKERYFLNRTIWERIKNKTFTFSWLQENYPKFFDEIEWEYSIIDLE